MQATGGALQRIGAYAVERAIGRGGTGTVVLARDPKLGRSVAVKLLTVADPQAAARMRGEAQLMAGFAHPHLLPILDVGEDTDGLYIVMPYMAGGSVDRLVVTGGPLTPGRAAAVLVAVAEALAAMHAHGVVHRNVKPTNVFLSGDGEVFLGDLGLAWTLTSERLTVAGSFSGTLSYTAPEVANGAPPSSASDVFSLGVLGYYLLAGVGPFDGDNPATVVAKLVSGTWMPLAEIRPDAPPALVQLVEAAMAADPGTRPKALLDWAAQVRIAAPPEAIAVTPATLIPPPVADAAPSMRMCTACGGEVPVGDAFCGDCGAAISAQPLPEPHEVVVPSTYAVGTATPPLAPAPLLPVPPPAPYVSMTTERASSGVPETAMHAAIMQPSQPTSSTRASNRTLPVVLVSLAGVCVAALVVLLVLLAGRGDKVETAADDPGPVAKTAGMAAYATDGDLGFTATDFACGVTIGSLAPKGKFCQVGLTVRNVDDAAPHTYLPAVQELTASGTTMRNDAPATGQADTANGGRDVSVPVGQEVKAVLVFDAAADADPNSMKLTLHSAQGSQGVTVALAATPATPGSAAPGAAAPPPTAQGVSSCAELQAQGMRYPDVVAYYQQHNTPSSMMTAAGRPCGDVYSYDEVVYDDPAKDKVGRCADLRAKHTSYPDAYNYWLSAYDPQVRSLMDLHGDGVPCGSKYPYDAVATFTRAGVDP